MTLWHLVQIDSRCKRQTGRHVRDRPFNRQADRQGRFMVSIQQYGIGSSEGLQAGGDFATSHPPRKVQWILADRGEEDTGRLDDGFSTQPSTFSSACDLEAVQGGARRSLIPVLSSLDDSVKRKSSRRSREEEEEEEEDDHGGDSKEEDKSLVSKELPQLFITTLSSSFSLVVPSKLLIGLSPGHTLMAEGGRSWFNCLSAFSLSSRKNSAVARKNMPPRTMMKGQSMRAQPKLRNCHSADVAYLC